MYFLTLDKIFVLDNFSFVKDKKYLSEQKDKAIKQKMDFLTLDKIFVLDNLYFVLDKNSLVGADA